MNKLIVVAVVALSLVSGLASAGIIMKGSNGELRVVEPVITWEATGVDCPDAIITAGKTDTCIKAYKTPGKMAVITEHTEEYKDGLFHTIKQTVVDGVMYTAENGMREVYAQKGESSRHFKSFFIFAIVSFIGVIWMSLMTSTGDKEGIGVIICVLLTTIATTSGVYATIATTVAFVSALFAAASKGKSFHFFTIICFIASLFSIGLFVTT